MQQGLLKKIVMIRAGKIAVQFIGYAL